MMIQLELVPVPLTDRFDAIMPDGRILVRSRQPLFDGARKLAALGYDPDILIEARYRHSPIVAMRSTIGEAAKWTIKERDSGGLRKERWQPFMGRPSSPGGPPGADDGLAKDTLWPRVQGASTSFFAAPGDEGASDA